MTLAQTPKNVWRRLLVIAIVVAAVISFPLGAINSMFRRLTCR